MDNKMVALQQTTLINNDIEVVKSPRRKPCTRRTSDLPMKRIFEF